MSSDPYQAEILVIDDEIQIRRLLRVTLNGAGYSLREADTGQAGLAEVGFKRPDAVVLDLGLPDQSGHKVLKDLRAFSTVPILVLTVRNQDAEKIAALDGGADDYLTKPFSGGELLARLRVMLRRSEPADDLKVVRFGDVEVDLVKRITLRQGKDVKLTVKEQALLRLLVVNAGKVLTHSQILREVWGPNAEGQTQYLRVYMSRLRCKLERVPTQPEYLRTEPGVGYRLVERTVPSTLA